MSSFDDVKTEKNAKINVTFPKKKKKKCHKDRNCRVKVHS